VKKADKNIKYYEISESGNKLNILPVEPLIYSNAYGFREILDKLDSFKDVVEITIDYSRQIDFDTYLIVFKGLVQNYCIENKILFSELNISHDIESVILLLKSPPESVVPPKPKTSFLYRHFEQVGGIVLKVFGDVYNFISFFGELFIIPYFTDSSYTYALERYAAPLYSIGCTCITYHRNDSLFTWIDYRLSGCIAVEAIRS
jgi:hypothetical protein